MRFTIIICFAASTLFCGCAYEGVIVEKRFRPVPFSESLGVDAIYNFQLRDSAGQIHSQMVTADVFAWYNVGEYFNDLQPRPMSAGGKDFKEIQQPAAPVEMNQAPFRPQVYKPVKTTRVNPRSKHPARISKSQHRAKDGAKIAKTNHRTTHHRKVAQSHKAQRRPAQT